MGQILHITTLAYDGGGIARGQDGKAVFVEGAAPGDTVLAELESDRSTYARARTVEVLEAGPDRAEPACALAGACGGCHWQHVSYEAQCRAKRANVVDALQRIAHVDGHHAQSLVEACLAAKHPLAYRNKLELACAGDAQGRFEVGFAKPRSHELVPISACPLAHKPAQRAPKALRGALRYLQGAGSDLGIFRIGVRCSVRTGSFEVALWTAPGAFPRKEVAKTLSSALKTTSIVRVLAKEGKQRKVVGVEVLSGAGNWTEEVGGLRMRASAPSFFQVNTSQADVLVRTVVDGLGLRPRDRVADLYCGVGTFALHLAQRAGDVVAVEAAGSSVRDLRRNAESLGAPLDILGGDSARELDDLGPLDAAVVDPPRAGLAASVPSRLAACGIRKLAYVSCDPATWARDVARLADCGFALVRAVPIDLFPQTYHCEIASFFDRI